MNFLEIVALSLYLMFAFCSWIVFACWLHDTKPEMKGSWLGSIVVAASLACVWPVSLAMLYFNERGKLDK